MFRNYGWFSNLGPLWGPLRIDNNGVHCSIGTPVEIGLGAMLRLRIINKGSGFMVDTGKLEHARPLHSSLQIQVDASSKFGFHCRGLRV